MNTQNRFNETTSEQQFNSITRAITDNSSSALFLLDAAGVCTFLNPTAEMIFGFTLAELQGKPLHDYIHHTHPDGSPFPLEKCPIGKSVFSLQNLKEYEDVFLDKDGKFIPIKCSAKPLSNSSGELTGILLEVRDIRSEKHAEKLLRASEERYREIATKLESLVHEKIHELKNTNEDLQKFAHVASHDLKEPVRKIRYFLNRLGDSALARLTPEEKLYFSKIERSADRLNMMIEGVLQYSMTNGMDQKSEHVDLTVVFKEIINELELLILEKSARIECGPLPEIQGFSFLLYQLFYNIVLNALKFTRPDTEPLVRVTSKVSGNETEITIADNGIGFDPAYADSIFDPFTRLNPRDAFEGTGLGLSLCKKIVDRHGGKIRSQGRPNEGATFIITLPLTQDTTYVKNEGKPVRGEV